MIICYHPLTQRSKQGNALNNIYDYWKCAVVGTFRHFRNNKNHAHAWIAFDEISSITDFICETADQHELESTLKHFGHNTN